jgi:hypothetical protein
MGNIDKVKINKFIGGIYWATIPVLNDIAAYLSKSDIVELSKACKYLRSKLSSKVFYQLNLFNHVYRNYRETNNIKLDIRNLRNLICTKMIDDLGSKSKLVKKVVITSLITSKFANLFFKIFNHCTTVIIDCEYDFRLSTVYSILKHLSRLEIFFMEGICDQDPKSILPPQNFKFPKTLKSITTYPYVLYNSYIPAINEINFITHNNILHWNVSGRYDVERFFHQQPNIIHLCLHDVPAIKFDIFKSILVNNPQLRTLAYEIYKCSNERLNTILALPKLKKLLVFNSSRSIVNFTSITSLNLIANCSINTLILHCIGPLILIEELLIKLNSLKHIVFISWMKSSLSAINWLQYKGKFNTITFGKSPYTENDLRHLVDCLKPETKIIFDYTVKRIVNYDLSI